jgi:hypothetical protein
LLIQSSCWFPCKPPRNTSQLSWYVFAQPIQLLASLKPLRYNSQLVG